MYNSIWFTRDASRERIEIMRNYVFRPTPDRDNNAKQMMKELREERKKREKLENEEPRPPNS